VLAQTALPPNGATSFQESEDSAAVQSSQRDSEPSEEVATHLAEAVPEAALFIRMLNEGNLIDIAAEFKR